MENGAGGSPGGGGKDDAPKKFSMGFKMVAKATKRKRDDSDAELISDAADISAKKPRIEKKVIPLEASRYNYREPKKAKKDTVPELLKAGKENTAPPAGAAKKSLEEEAAAALEEDALRLAGELPGEEEPEQEKRSILQKGLIAGIEALVGDKEKVQFDVMHRPEQATQEDYLDTPIDGFGAALLRGQGWEEGKTIGMNNRGLAKPVQFNRRPHRKGLSAKVEGPKKRHKKYIKPGESREQPQEMVAPPRKEGVPKNMRGIDEQLVPAKRTDLHVDGKVTLTRGRHKGLEGIVLHLNSDDVVVRLAVSEEMVQVPRKDAVLTYMLKEKEKAEKRKDQESGGGKAKSKPKPAKQEQPWLRSRIRVRIVSKKSFHKGKYYNKKGTVFDVVDAFSCIVRLDDGSTVDGVPQKALETVVPKSEGSRVMLLRGEHRGALGQMLLKDTKKNVMHVQLLEDSEVVQCSLDDCAEYV